MTSFHTTTPTASPFERAASRAAAAMLTTRDLGTWAAVVPDEDARPGWALRVIGVVSFADLDVSALDEAVEFVQRFAAEPERPVRFAPIPFDDALGAQMVDVELTPDERDEIASLADVDARWLRVTFGAPGVTLVGSHDVPLDTVPAELLTASHMDALTALFIASDVRSAADDAFRSSVRALRAAGTN